MRVLRQWWGISLMLVGCSSNLATSTSAQQIPTPDTELSGGVGAFLMDNHPVQGVLLDGLTQWVMEHSMDFQGVLAIRIPATARMADLRVAVASATKAGFHTAWLVVQSNGGQEKGVRLSLGAPKKATQRARKIPKEEEVAAHWANPTLVVSPSIGLILTAFDDVYGKETGLTLPCTKPQCAQDSYPMVELSRMARRLKLDHPGDRAVVVQTTADVTVQTFVSTLDALRDDSFTGRHRMDMFPSPIFNPADPK